MVYINKITLLKKYTLHDGSKPTSIELQPGYDSSKDVYSINIETREWSVTQLISSSNNISKMRFQLSVCSNKTINKQQQNSLVTRDKTHMYIGEKISHKPNGGEKDNFSQQHSIGISTIF